jgi:adenylate cyclase
MRIVNTIFARLRKNKVSADSVQRTVSLQRARRRMIRRLQIGLLIGVFIGLTLALVIGGNGLRPFESRLADWFYRPRAPSNDIVLIIADDKTVEEYGWPIERVIHSGLLFAVMRFQPKLIVLNFAFPEPALPIEDDYFAVVLRRGGKIIQPVIGIEATRYPADVSFFPAYDLVLLPTAPLRTPNTTLAHTMIYPDSDGVTRRVPLAIDTPTGRYPSVALAAFALAQGDEPTVTVQEGYVHVGKQRIPVDSMGQMLLHYVNRDAVTRISYVDITQGRANYELLRNKIVLIGPATTAVHESYTVPATISHMPASNVEIQADAIETLLGGNFLRASERSVLAVEAFLIALVAGLTLPHLSLLYATALVLLYFAVYLVYAFNRFDNGIVTTPLYAMLALTITFALTMLYRYLSEERGRALVARTFLGIVSPDTVNQVLVEYERGALSLGGGRREATILCVSLRELTSLSDTMAAETLIELINRYTACVMEVVFRWDGSVNKAGNNIFAAWNLPLDHPDHARRAVHAAFDIIDAIKRIQPLSAEHRTGVCLGIATGTAIAGRVGGTLRADYTVIGEVVTIAERVSILAGENQVLIDPATYEIIQDEFETQPVHTIRVRGKKDPLVIREVLPPMPIDLQ